MNNTDIKNQYFDNFCIIRFSFFIIFSSRINAYLYIMSSII